MSKPHTGNHGSHKWTKAKHKIGYARKQFFESGGLFFSLLALALLILFGSIIWGATHGWSAS